MSFLCTGVVSLWLYFPGHAGAFPARTLKPSEPVLSTGASRDASRTEAGSTAIPAVPDVLPSGYVLTHDPAANQPAGPSWQTVTVKRGDSLSSLFHRLGLSAATVQAVVHLGDVTRPLTRLKPGDRLRVALDKDGDLAGLRYAAGALSTLVLRRVHGKLQARTRRRQAQKHPVRVAGKISGSLSGSLHQAGVSTSVIQRLIDALHYRVDFRRDIRKGDRFEVVYEELLDRGKVIKTGPLDAVELQLHGRTVDAFRYVDADGDERFYDRDGRSLTPTLLRTPVHYKYVSSSFSRNRYHPILHVWRPHWGVDLAAHKGTPVKAAGDGTVTFMGRQPGYGNVIKIDNFGPYSTRYAHLHGFAKSLHRGEHVSQGQVIGYVGETGEATGPHLHFEIRVHGKPKDPLHVHLPDATPVPSGEMARFKTRVPNLLAALHGDVAPEAVNGTVVAQSNNGD